MNLSMEANDQELPIRLLLRAIGSSPHNSNPSPYIHFDNNALNHQSSRLGLGVVGPEHLGFSMERLSLSSSMSNNIPNHYDDGLRRTRNTITSSAAGIRLGSQPQQIYLPPQHENGSEGKHRLIEMILSKVKDRLHELMMDKNSIHLIETFFEASTVSQNTVILDLLVRDQHKLAKVCIHGDGYVLRALFHSFPRFLFSFLHP